MQEVDLKNIKFSEGCDMFLEYKINSVKESTYFIYKFAIEKHLKPDLGDINLFEIQNFDFNNYINEKKEKVTKFKVSYGK